MVDISVGDIVSEVLTSDLRVVAHVKKACSARPKGYQFMPRFRKRQWDGFISLAGGKTFPTGLLDVVKKAIEAQGYTVNVLEGERTAEVFPIVPEMLEGITLRNYQVQAARELLEAGRGIAKMATNSGKTEIIAALVKAIEGNATILVHRKELLHQTAERISKRTGLAVGKIGDGIFEPADVTVAMIQTLQSRGDYSWCSHNVLLAVDECHHGSSDKYLDALSNIPGSYRYGFSGTPLKYDLLSDMKLIGATGDIVTEISNIELIEKGFSATPTVFVHIVEAIDEDLDYQEAYSYHIVENKERNDCIATVAKNEEGVTLVLVSRIRHGNVLQDLIPGSIFVHGSHTTDRRMEVLEAMREGKDGVYIATPIFDEGVDVPGVDTVIIAGGGKSHIKLLQRIGRGMRAKKDRENVLHIHDFLDDTNTYLFDHSVQRIEIYDAEGFEKKIS